LDAQSTERVEKVLRKRLADGGAIVLVTHDPEQALRMASAHYELEDGRIREQGP
jgi:ABC-type sulfate/molybdate transport systems ATPase subunit